MRLCAFLDLETLSDIRCRKSGTPAVDDCQPLPLVLLFLSPRSPLLLLSLLPLRLPLCCPLTPAPLLLPMGSPLRPCCCILLPLLLPSCSSSLPLLLGCAPELALLLLACAAGPSSGKPSAESQPAPGLLLPLSCLPKHADVRP